jgi:integrase/recombinase XerD
MPAKVFMHPAISVYTRRKKASSTGKEYWGFEPVNLGAGRKPAGPFWLRHTENGKQKWVSAGDDYTAAIELREKMTAVKLADRQGLNIDEADRKEAADIGSMTLADAVAAFLKKKQHKRPNTLQAYGTTLENFRECLGSRVRFTNELTEDSVLQFVACMKKAGLSPKTIRTRAMYVKIFLKEMGCAVTVNWQNMPKAPKKKVLAYSEEHWQKLMKAADADDAALLLFLVGTGCREQEAAHAEYSDFDFAHRIYTVQEKKQWGFLPKSYEARDITLAAELVELFKGRKKHATSTLLFPNTTGQPDGHLLRVVKGVAFRAGLNCGKCMMGKKDGAAKLSCKDHPVCKEHFTHRLRKTFATRRHHHGTPLRDLQGMLGHESLQTTQDYLAESDRKDSRLRDAADRASF